MELRRAVFLDRDGVINRSPAPGDYVRRWEDFQLIPQAVEWIRRFNAMDLPVIVVTNQRGVGRGLMEAAALDRIHAHMRRELAKPRPGLVLEAARKWRIDLGRSVLLGDSWRDRDLAERCGMDFVEVREGRMMSEVPA